MSRTEIAAILRFHGIDFSVNRGNIYAHDIACKSGIVSMRYKDLTGISFCRLAVWLGY